MRLLTPTLLTLLFIAGCKPGSYFTTPNDVHLQPATLYLNNNDTIPGQLTVRLENFFQPSLAYKGVVNFIPKGKMESKEYSLRDVRGYRIGTTFYPLKICDVAVNGITRLLFVKQLTSDSSKIQLYELHESGQASFQNESANTYYLSLAGMGQYETINSHSARLLPGFEDKMSAIVDDCPALAKKIRAKQEGYFIPFTSFKASKHPDVLMKIISEYNNCH